MWRGPFGEDVALCCPKAVVLNRHVERRGECTIKNGFLQKRGFVSRRYLLVGERVLVGGRVCVRG
jgi:hypothetical protein